MAACTAGKRVSRDRLAPWSPPTKLVTVSLYRVSRNPTYVVTYEEPVVMRTFGAEWVAYRSRVLRWFGRRDWIL